jgi:SAM-dependent methyltransferase
VASKPEFWGPRHGAAFRLPGVVAAYDKRPPYPDETFGLLRDLIVDRPVRALDLGCGPGVLARRMVDFADRVDALDLSEGMVEAGRRMPNGDHPRLRWIVGPAETAPLDPPYALVTAGASLHWMDWDTVLPRLARGLTPNGALAIVEDAALPVAWGAELMPLLGRYSVLRTFRAGVSLIDELERFGLFEVLGRRETAPIAFRQSLGDYVESFHGRAGFPRERMGPDEAEAFDRAVREVVRRHAGDAVEFQVYATVVWGRPLEPAQSS